MSKKQEKNGAGSGSDTENVVLYKSKTGDVELRTDGEHDTIWATQAQIAQLFETTPQNVTVHIGKIYEEGELEEKATSKFYLQVQKEGARAVKRQVMQYNLDVIIAVGYRVSSNKATQFRIWATKILRDHITKGKISLGKISLNIVKDLMED